MNNEEDIIVIKNFSNRDIRLLLIYITQFFLTSIVYTIINRIVLPRIGMNGDGSAGARISSLYLTTNIIAFAVDILLIVLLLILLESKLATRFFIVLLIVRIALMIFNYLI